MACSPSSVHSVRVLASALFNKCIEVGKAKELSFRHRQKSLGGQVACHDPLPESVNIPHSLYTGLIQFSLPVFC